MERNKQMIGMDDQLLCPKNKAGHGCSPKRNSFQWRKSILMQKHSSERYNWYMINRPTTPGNYGPLHMQWQYQ